MPPRTHVATSGLTSSWRRARAPRLWLAGALGLWWLSSASPAGAAGDPPLVDVRAGVTLGPTNRHRAYAWLGIHLGSLLWGRSSAAAPTDPPNQSLGEAPAGEAPAGDAAPGGSRPARVSPDVEARLDASLARAALRASRRASALAGVERRLSSMASRSRLAAGLPDVRLRAGTSRDESLRLTPTVADPARYTQTGQSDLWFEAGLTWHLARAAFDEDEIRIERLRDGARRERRERDELVLRLLVTWQEQTLRARSRWVTDEKRASAALAALAARLRLDSLTGGWFSRHLPAGAS